MDAQRTHHELPVVRDLRDEKEYSLRQKWALLTYTLQLLGFLFALGATSEDGKAVVFIGPFAAIPGFAFALVTWTMRSWRVLALGLSAPLVMSVSALVATYLDDRGLRQTPTPIVLIVYGLVLIRLSSAAWRQILRQPATRKYESTLSHPWQYSLKFLLLVMSTLAVLLGLVRWVASGRDVDLFIRLAGLNLALCGILTYWFAIYYPKTTGPCMKN